MNAKEELLNVLARDKKEMLCARITYTQNEVWGTWVGREEEPKKQEPKTLLLFKNYTQEELEEFLEDLNIEYDDGYGLQEIKGTIWCRDESWYERQDYDGAEWWVLRQRPPVPKLLEEE